MAYNTFFTGIPALSLTGTVDSREYTRLMSYKLNTAVATITGSLSGSLITSNPIQYIYMSNAIFAIITYNA